MTAATLPHANPAPELTATTATEPKGQALAAPAVTAADSFAANAQAGTLATTQQAANASPMAATALAAGSMPTVPAALILTTIVAMAYLLRRRQKGGHQPDRNRAGPFSRPFKR